MLQAVSLEDGAAREAAKIVQDANANIVQI